MFLKNLQILQLQKYDVIDQENKSEGLQCSKKSYCAEPASR